MAVDAEAGGRTPSMRTRFDAQGRAHSSDAGDADDELLFLMSLDSEVPAEALADAMCVDPAGQHRSGLNWPPLSFGYPTLVVPERLESVWVARESGLLMPVQQGLAGQGLDAPLLVHCIAPPTMPVPTIPPPEAYNRNVDRNLATAARVSDDYHSVPAADEKDQAGTSIRSDIAAQLRIFRNELAASGSFVMQDLLDLLAENGGARHSHFLGGEVARTDVTRRLIALLGDMVAMQGTPQARFDQTNFAGFGLKLLQWCGRSSSALSRFPQPQRYSVGMRNLIDENVINTIVLQAMCGSEKMRNFMLGIFSELHIEYRDLFKLSTKIKIFRQWAAGEIALSATELRALCVLKVVNNASPNRLLFLIRRHADQLSLADMDQHDRQYAISGLVTQ